MNHSDTNDVPACGEIKELIVWYPGRSLGQDERRRVEAHVAGCATCAELLDFSASLQEQARLRASRHPATEHLVIFAEDRTALAEQQCASIEDHLAFCPDCRRKLVMLEKVDADSPYHRAAGTDDAAPIALWRKLRDLFTAPFHHPVWAAAYLAVALIAGGLHLFRTDSGLEHTLDPGSPATVSILADETGRSRDLSSLDEDLTVIRADRPHFLLLELMSLGQAPPAGDQFHVEFRREEMTKPDITATVTGAEIGGSLTLCLPVAAGALTPGRYRVHVLGPGGEPVYRSTTREER